jgi:hypothetical protein
MNTEGLVYIAITVFLLMLIGLVLTIIEFKKGAPKEQIEDKGKVQDSPHGHVD